MVLVHDDDLERILRGLDRTVSKDHLIIDPIFDSFVHSLWKLSNQKC